MEQEELKRKLLGLWEKTSHTPKELLGLLFDLYFDADLVEYKENDGKIVSALCGIPYEFGYGDRKLKGVYIISLSAEEGYKKKGILSELLLKFNDRVKDNYEFSFLVAHTELLADYYGTQGYLSSFYIFEERYTPLHDFKNDYFLSLTDSEEKIKKLKEELYGKIKVVLYQENHKYDMESVIRFLNEVEKKSSTSINLCHKDRDFEYLLSPGSLRNLNCFISFDTDDKITGVAFTQKDEPGRIRVVAIFVSDPCSYFVLLDNIKRYFSDYSISVNVPNQKFQQQSLIWQLYASSNPKGGDLENTFGMVEIPFNINRLLHPLGMVKILKFDNILKYIAETRRDIEFKLHIRDLEPLENDQRVIYEVKNGKCNKVIVDSIPDNKNILNISIKEISELLLRKNDSSNLIMEAFGIPRLDLQIRLLPC